MWWRKKSDGFEWREYVRTTILLRRAERRRRIDDVKAQAADSLKRAGQHGKDAARDAFAGAASGIGAAGAAGASAAGRVAQEGRQAGATALSALWATTRRGAHYVWWSSTAGLAWTAHTLVRLAAPVAARLRLPRALAAWLDRAGNGLVLLPALDRLSPRSAVVATVTGLVAVAALGVWSAGGLPQAPSLPTLPAISVSDMFAREELTGRATAKAGDRLEVGGTIVVLDGIEAPLPNQMCARPSGRRWTCGSSAREALARAVRGRAVLCEVWSRIDGGTVTGRCLASGEDVAETLVRAGAVFAEQGLFARYASAELEAQEKRSGLWDGEPQRPDAYKTALWDEAKEKAPGGCPIKGRVSSEGRVYLVPWAQGYGAARIRETRGERWFCSEAEAESAGWRPDT